MKSPGIAQTDGVAGKRSSSSSRLRARVFFNSLPSRFEFAQSPTLIEQLDQHGLAERKCLAVQSEKIVLQASTLIQTSVRT